MTNHAQRWLQAEGLAVLLLSLALYTTLERSGWFLVLLFFAPDLSMLAYGAGSRAGAAVYNLFHSYTAPLLLGGVGVWVSGDTILAVALIWTAHIGFDRLLGYGLKLPSGFRDTHLGRIGKSSG